MNTRYQRLSVRGRRLEAAAVAGAVLLTIVLLRLLPAERTAGAWDRGCDEGGRATGHALSVADWRPETVEAAARERLRGRLSVAGQEATRINGSRATCDR